MRKQISFSQYRSIDLTILAVVLVISQILINAASTNWYVNQPYVVSPVAAVAALVMMRWGAYVAVHAVLGGAVYVLLSGGNMQQLAIYCIGNLAAMAVLVMFRVFSKERIRESAFLTVMFAFMVQIAMQLGRAAVAAIFGNNLSVCLGFITTDVLSVLFTTLIIWIARRVDGLFEDQRNYLLRQEREAERRDVP